MPKKEWPPCQVCGKPVSTQQGVLIVFDKELDQYQGQYLEWKKGHPLDTNGARVLSTKDLTELPELVKWHWGHASCLPGSGYEIEYSRFDTISKALSWTLHLAEKNWLPFTEWESAVRTHHKVSHA